MIHTTDRHATIESSATEKAERFSINIFPRIFLPRKIYEALPTAYIVMGMLFILGVVYIGIGHGPMTAYLAVGLSCILAGVAVNSMRRKRRSSSENAFA